MKRLLVIIALVLVTGLALGALSIRPFTILYRPARQFYQWYRIAYPPEDNAHCKAQLLEKGARFESREPGRGVRARGCGMDTPVMVYSTTVPYRNISLNPPTEVLYVGCSMALKIQDFVDNFLMPLARERFGEPPVRVLHKGTFVCREQGAGSTLKSEHAFGEAWDFAGLEFADGRLVLIENDFGADSSAGRFFREVAERGCENFGTALGPGFDELHHDHLHFSTGFPALCKF